MSTGQNYDPSTGPATPNEPSAQNSPRTAYTSPQLANLSTAAYGPWLLVPALHKPWAVATTVDQQKLSLYAEVNYRDLGARLVIILEALDLSGYAVAKNGPVSAATISNIRSGRQQPSSQLITWLVNHYPQVNLDFLFLEEGEPIVPLIAAKNSAPRLSTEELNRRVTLLTDRLYAEVYPALSDEANLLYENDEAVILSDRALAINLHREFVEALGTHQADWWGEYWQELGWLFERLSRTAEQRIHLLTDPVFLSLLHAFAA